MSLLSYLELVELQKQGVIENSLLEHVNSTSIDVTLGERILSERITMGIPSVSVRSRDALSTIEFNFPLDEDQHFLLRPGQFILAQSEQIFNLPNDISCEYKLRSSLARVGLEHMNAGWCDAGWHGSVFTLEFKNLTQNHTIKLRRGDRIGQVIFFRHTPVPEYASYATKGHYNNDTFTSGVKK